MYPAGYYIFNPDTEMALASDGVSYTPPEAVARFICNLSLFPALYAPEGSTIILPDKVDVRSLQFIPYYDIAKAKDLSFAYAENLKDAPVTVWGWNKAIQKKLSSANISDRHLPSVYAISNLRQLAHRATTQKIFAYFSHDVFIKNNVPRFFDDIDNAKTYIQFLRSRNIEYVVKMPWSSSGRGVFFNLENDALLKAMHKQHGVMIEHKWDVKLDCASEWYSKGGKIKFIGLSIFENSAYGNYKGNIVASQQLLRHRIANYCEIDYFDKVISQLNNALEEVIAPYYNGPLGVDMIIDKAGNINPCVEINFRMTMGHVAIRVYDQMKTKCDTPFHFYPGKELPVDFS